MMIIDPYRFGGGAPQAPFFTFKTKFIGEVTFEITSSAPNTAIWYMGDGTIYANTDSVTHIYADDTEKTVSVAVTDFGDVTGIGDFRSKGITFFDASDLTNLGGQLWFSNNTEMATISLPTSSATLTGIRVDNTDLTSIDWSGFSDVRGVYYFHTNPQLTSIINPTQSAASGSCSYIYLYNTGITSFDFSGITKWANQAQVRGENNPSLTSVTFPEQDTGFSFRFLWFKDCNLTGIVDLSNYTFTSSAGGDWRFDNNPNLTGATFNSTKLTGGQIRLGFDDCNISGVFDLSKVSNLARIDCSRNSGITGITLPETTFYDDSNIQLIVVANDCNITGNVDLSLTSFVSGSFNDNPNLTHLEFPAFSTTTQAGIYAVNCNLTGVIDLTPYNVGNRGGKVSFGNNPNLTGITMWTSSNIDTSQNFSFVDCSIDSYIDFSGLTGFMDALNVGIRLENNLLTAAQINQMLDVLDGLATSAVGSTNFRFDGTGNSAPDSSSGGVDGLAAKSSLISKGFNVTTN